jgi:putative spermidine/putrescine transport system substrate-binding protein
VGRKIQGPHHPAVAAEHGGSRQLVHGVAPCDGQADERGDQGYRRRWVIVSALSSYALERKAQGAPIDLAAPKEGIFASPSGICVVKGAAALDLAFAYINELLGAEIQAKISAPTFALPTNQSVPPPVGMPTNVTVHSVDWAYVAANRDEWVKRWDREMAI